MSTYEIFIHECHYELKTNPKQYMGEWVSEWVEKWNLGKSKNPSISTT